MRSLDLILSGCESGHYKSAADIEKSLTLTFDDYLKRFNDDDKEYEHFHDL